MWGGESVVLTRQEHKAWQSLRDGQPPTGGAGTVPRAEAGRVSCGGRGRPGEAPNPELPEWAPPNEPQTCSWKTRRRGSVVAWAVLADP